MPDSCVGGAPTPPRSGWWRRRARLAQEGRSQPGVPHGCVGWGLIPKSQPGTRQQTAKAITLRCVDRRPAPTSHSRGPFSPGRTSSVSCGCQLAVKRGADRIVRGRGKPLTTRICWGSVGAPGRNRTPDPLLRRARGRRGIASSCVSCTERACRRGQRAAPRTARRPYTAPLQLAGGPSDLRTACAPSGRGLPRARRGPLGGWPPARLRRGAPLRPLGPEPRRAPPGENPGASGNPRPAWHRT